MNTIFMEDIPLVGGSVTEVVVENAVLRIGPKSLKGFQINELRSGDWENHSI